MLRLRAACSRPDAASPLAPLPCLLAPSPEAPGPQGEGSKMGGEGGQAQPQKRTDLVLRGPQGGRVELVLRGPPGVPTPSEVTCPGSHAAAPVEGLPGGPRRAHTVNLHTLSLP